MSDESTPLFIGVIGLLDLEGKGGLAARCLVKGGASTPGWKGCGCGCGGKLVFMDGCTTA